MKKYGTVATVALIALLVMAIGGLAGWLVVLRMNGQTLSWQDAARGFGFGAPTAGANGSTYSDIGIGGGGAGGFSTGAGVGGAGGGAGNGSVGGTGGNGLSGSGGTGGDGQNGSSASSSMSISYSSSTLPTVVIPKTPRLWHVTKTPVAGFRFATSSPRVFFAERATGYIFTADAISGEILRRTNTLFPKTYEAFLARDGAALYRSINGATGAIQTFSGVMGSSSSSNLGALIGINLPNNILAMDANPESKTIFFVSAADDGTFSGFTEPWVEGKSGKQKQVFNSAVASWKPIVLADGRLIVVEKPQDDAAGYAYEVEPDGSLRPLVREAPGLTFLPLANSGAFIFGTSQSGALTLYAQTSAATLSLAIKTVADKCVWAPYTSATKKTPASDLVVYCAVPATVGGKNFLENWYMGISHTDDSWWRVDITTGETNQILAADTGGSQLDVADPAIDPSGNFLGFRNNVDGTLWVLRVNK